MSNKMYPKGAEKLLRGEIKFHSDDISFAIVSDSYTYSAAHEFLDEVGTLVGSAIQASGVSVTGGVLDANDAEFGAIAAGATGKAVVVFKDSGSGAASSPLLMYLDDIVGFPFATNGSAVTVNWSDGASKIMSLV